MGYTLEAVSDGQYLHLLFDEACTFEERLEARNEIGRMLSELGWRRALIDFRRVQTKYSTMENYRIGSTHEEAGVHWGRHAIVVRPEDEDDFHFLETLSINRGIGLKIFTDEAEAIAWILK